MLLIYYIQYLQISHSESKKHCNYEKKKKLIEERKIALKAICNHLRRRLDSITTIVHIAKSKVDDDHHQHHPIRCLWKSTRQPPLAFGWLHIGAPSATVQSAVGFANAENWKEITSQFSYSSGAVEEIRDVSIILQHHHHYHCMLWRWSMRRRTSLLACNCGRHRADGCPFFRGYETIWRKLHRPKICIKTVVFPLQLTIISCVFFFSRWCWWWNAETMLGYSIQIGQSMYNYKLFVPCIAIEWPGKEHVIRSQSQ